MATNPSADGVPGGLPATSSAATSLSATTLRRRLRGRLERSKPTGELLIVGWHEQARGTHLVRTNGDPAAALLGFVLPRRFGALGIFAPSVMRDGQERHRDAVLGIAMNRLGDPATMLATPDLGVIETNEPHGWVVDACRRSVGLPTPPTEAHPLELPLALWLDRVMVELVRAKTPLDWVEVAALCPVPFRWSCDDPDDLGAVLATVTKPWAALRRAAAAGAALPVRVTAAWAAWMDDSMFARWCLGAFPPIDELRSDVEFLASPEIAECIDHTIQAALVFYR